MQKNSSKLDWTRMLGFEQVLDSREVAGTTKLGAKVGGKAGLKLGLKLGLKDGLKN